MRSIRQFRRHDRARGGFTLAELIVAIGLMTLLVSILFSILVSAQDTVTETRRAASIHENAIAALDFMRDEILNSKPPRNDRASLEPGHMFVIRNNPRLDGDDELWITTGSGVDSKGRPVRKNVRYFVEEDPDVGLKVLKRQEYSDLYADYTAPCPPTDKDTATICEYIEHFDVAFLRFIKVDQYKAILPVKFKPGPWFKDPLDINFRTRAGCGARPSPNQAAPPAVRITMVVHDRRGRQSYFIQRVFLVPFNTIDPDQEEPPPPSPEELK